MTARKKKLLQREGLGQLPIHGVCAFAIARLNQYVSNSAWNTISPCLKRRRKIHRSKIKDKPNVPLKSFHIQHIQYTAFQTAWQLVMCCSSRRKQTERKACICMNLQKRCLNVSAELIPSYCVGSWRYQAATEMHLWPAWPFPHTVCALKEDRNGKRGYSMDGWWYKIHPCNAINDCISRLKESYFQNW